MLMITVLQQKNITELFHNIIVMNIQHHDNLFCDGYCECIIIDFHNWFKIDLPIIFFLLFRKTFTSWGLDYEEIPMQNSHVSK